LFHCTDGISDQIMGSGKMTDEGLTGEEMEEKIVI
jgi:hypothetical protein